MKLNILISDFTYSGGLSFYSKSLLRPFSSVNVKHRFLSARKKTVSICCRNTTRENTEEKHIEVSRINDSNGLCHNHQHKSNNLQTVFLFSCCPSCILPIACVCTQLSAPNFWVIEIDRHTFCNAWAKVNEEQMAFNRGLLAWGTYEQRQQRLDSTTLTNRSVCTHTVPF